MGIYAQVALYSADPISGGVGGCLHPLIDIDIGLRIFHAKAL